ncbi:MAG: alkaline phosphatase family protein, partial [Frankiales bacterium]|nr:alkaline phosphatase family protein [Frankiales bacterium]
HAALHEDVIALAGEPRMRHVHTTPGAADAVATRWRELLGDGWVVLTGDVAIDAGLFGPVVTDSARRRIGDVIALATGNGGVVERRRLPRLASMPGQHGSLTDDELLVPLLRLR